MPFDNILTKICDKYSWDLLFLIEASVSDYAVTGNDVGTGSLLAALADVGFLIGLVSKGTGL
jgi:hypothetical protein